MSRPGSYVIPGQTAMDGRGESQNAVPGLLIDWLTMRIPVNELGPLLQEKLFSCVDVVACLAADLSTVRWESKRFNFEELRSDSKGLYWTVKYVGPVAWFYLGASPASLTNDCNVFGLLDVQDAAETLIARARVALQSFLPMPHAWQCQRMDVTGNYALPDAAAVKVALRQLLGSDSCRRRASSSKKGGDTVLWSPESDLLAGKAYHKGPHLAHLIRAGSIDIDPEKVKLADRLLRLEMRIGARWFRRLRDGYTVGKCRYPARDWLQLTAGELSEVFRGFFEPLVGGVEVQGMERTELLERIKEANGLSDAAARSVLGTYRNIKTDGLEITRASMSERTFFRHKKALHYAGITDADLCLGNVVRLRPIRVCVAVPVASWEELRRAA